MFSTTDVGLASVLTLLGHQVIEVATNRGHGTFFFQDTQELETAKQNYYNRETTVEPIEYASQVKTLLNRARNT